MTAGILIKNALCIATFDETGRELHDHDLLILGNRISAIGRDIEPPDGCRVIEARGMLVLPGFVNCHHHLFQTLTRNVPLVQDCELFDWLTNLYEIWREITPEIVYIAALLGLGELLQTGCTTSTDHLYLFPRASKGTLIDAEIQAARELGIRFHPTRGCMSRGKSLGGLPPDDVVQTPDEIMADCERLIKLYQDNSPDAMVKMALAPCSPFSVDEQTMKDLAKLARSNGLRLHTHMAESKDEELYCQEIYGTRPIAWAAKLQWLGSDVWFAHVVHINDREIDLLSSTGTAVSHCPASNMRLGSGICPVTKMLDAGVRVGLGVDGSASNDTGDLWGEARNALLLQRVLGGAAAIDGRTTLRLACRGGAQVLGYENLGFLQPGALADLILIDLNKLSFAGAMHDPVTAPVFTGNSHLVEWSIINGRIVIERGKLVHKTEEEIITAANDAAKEMITSAGRKTGIKFLKPRQPLR